MTREKALTSGREPPDPRVITLEQEAARWQKRKENKKRATQREIRMLQKLIQLIARDEFFDDQLDLKNYIQITPEEVEEYLREREKDSRASRG